HQRPGSDLPPDRTQHRHGLAPVPPDRRHGPGVAAVRRQARRGRRRPARDRGLSGRGRSMSILEVKSLVAGYEPGLAIVKGASIHVDAGEIVVLLGPNGAGKSSLIKAIAGLVPISGGEVWLEGQDITAVPAHQKIRRGLAFVPQTE